MESNSSNDFGQNVTEDDLTSVFANPDKCKSQETVDYIRNQWNTPGSPICNWFDSLVKNEGEKIEPDFENFLKRLKEGDQM